MFPFNLLLREAKNKKTKHFEPLFKTRAYRLPLPPAVEIRKMAEKLSRCARCHFLIFDNYFSDEIENTSVKVCPTCGERV